MALRLVFLFSLLFTTSCFADAIKYESAPLNITEQDGSPSSYPYKLVVPNGSLTNFNTGAVLDFVGGSLPTTYLALNNSNQASWTPSTTLVTNLNADLLDGLHASDIVTVPGGSSGQIQFNNAGAFGGTTTQIPLAFTSAAIQTAINNLGTSGGEVYLPAGTYVISSKITIPYANTSIIGEGQGTILDASAWTVGTDNIFYWNVANIKFSNFYIKGSQNASVNTMESGTSGNYVWISDIVSENGNLDSLHLPSNHVWINNCRFINPYRYAVWQNAGYLWVDKCKFDTRKDPSSPYALYLGVYFGGQTNFYNITENTFNNADGAIWGYNMGWVNLTDNKIIYSDSSYSNFKVWFNLLSNSSIHGNTFHTGYYSSAYALRFDSSSTTEVNGNTFLGTNNAAASDIVLFRINGSNNLSIDGNSFYYAEYGIYMDGSCSNNVIGSGNSWSSVTNPITNLGTGNKILDSSSGSWLSNLNLNLGGNTLFGNTTSGGNLILSSSSNATKGNIYLGSSTSPTYYDEVNNNTYENGIVGNEMITNGDFSSATGWTVGSNWTISGGVASHTAGSGNLNQNITLNSGSYYVCQFDLTATSGGSLGIKVGSQNTFNYNTVQTLKKIFKATATGVTTISIQPGNTTSYTCTIDNFSIKPLTGGLLNVDNIIVGGQIRLPYGGTSDGVGGLVFCRNVGDTSGVGVLTYNDANTFTINTGFNMAGGLTGVTTAALSNTLTQSIASLTTTSTPKIIMQESSLSTSGTTVRMSPAFQITGHVWNTGGTPADNTSNWIIENLPTSGNPPTSLLKFGYDLNGGGYTYPMTLNQAGALTLLSSNTATNFISNVATGTQPYACTSTTLNTNLNADMVDSKHVGTSGNTIPLNDANNTLSGNNIFTGTTKLGDGTTNYIEFGTNGRLLLHGTARVSEQEKIPGTSASKGSAAPTDALRAIGASGGVLKPVTQFSKTTQQDVYFVFHAPYSCDFSDPVHFHLLWLPGSGWTTGNYVWKLEYLVKNENDPYNTGTPTTISVNVTPADATHIIETEFTDNITLTADDQTIICHFYRDVASDNADDTGDVAFFEMHFTKNKQGI